MHGLGVPGQARALQVQVGVDRAQALDRLRLEALEFLELGRGQALEVQVQREDGGLDLGVEVSLDGVISLADLALEVQFCLPRACCRG